jgi:hypothetical protein
MARGHSNVHAEQTKPYPTNPEKALIPIEGGAEVHSVKRLPPLALTKKEWETIGCKMGWITWSD